jgi:hypothetical protein
MESLSHVKFDEPLYRNVMKFIYWADMDLNEILPTNFGVDSNRTFHDIPQNRYGDATCGRKGEMNTTSLLGLYIHFLYFMQKH